MKYDVTISEVTTYRVEAKTDRQAYEIAHEGDAKIISQQTQTEDIHTVEEGDDEQGTGD